MADFSVEQIDGLVNAGRLDPQTAEMMKVNYGLVPAASQQPQEISTLVPAYPVDHTPNTAQFDTPLSNAAPPPIQAMNPSAGVGADGTPMQMGPSGNVISPTAPQAPAPTPPLPQGQVDVGPITTSQPPPQQQPPKGPGIKDPAADITAHHVDSLNKDIGFQTQQNSIDQQHSQKLLDIQQQETARQQAELNRRLAVEQKHHEDAIKSIAEQNRMADEIYNTKIDPDRAWKNTSTPEKIFATVAAFLVGISGDANAANMFINSINNTVNKDIQAQMQDVENKKAGLAGKRTAFTSLMDAYKDERAAAADLSIRGLAYTKQRIEELTANTSNQSVKINGAKALKALDDKIVEEKDRLAQYQYNKAISQSAQARAQQQKLLENTWKERETRTKEKEADTGRIHAETEKQKAGVKDTAEDYQYQQFMNNIEKVGGTIKTSMPMWGSEGIQQALNTKDSSKFRAAQAQLMLLLPSKGNASDADLKEKIKPMIPQVGDSDSTIDEKLKQIKAIVASNNPEAAMRYDQRRQSTLPSTFNSPAPKK